MTAVLVLGVSLVLARVGAFVTFLPLFGGQQVPRLVKVGLTLALTLAWADEVLANPNFAAWLVRSPGLPQWGFGLVVAREILVGALLGYAFGLFLIPARVAGEFLTQELGLAFGSQIDPGTGQAASPLTQFLDLLGTLLFFALDLHHVFLAVFHATFVSQPPASAVPAVPLHALVSGATQAQEWGLLLAAPTSLCLFLVTVVLALLARAAPQMSIFAVGFPLKLIVGLAALLVLLPGIAAALVAVCGLCGRWVLGGN